MTTPQDNDLALAPALDVDSILAIHRDPRGYIGFVRKPDPAAPPRLDKCGRPYSFENLFSIRADDLRSMFPALAQWLTHDSYFTVNAYFRAAPYTNRTTGRADVWRKEKHLRTLTACYSDIDAGRPESDEPGAALSWRQALHEAGCLADMGIIPQPSIFARSGRGVYLFWLLKDDKDPAKLPCAWPEKIELYKAINRALDARLREHRLPADLAAIDAARVLRVPGSIHRKAVQRVKYVIQADDSGRGFTYTLPDLARFLHLAAGGELPEATRELARPAQYRQTVHKGAAPLRSVGVKRLNALRALDLYTLQTWRGGFKKRGARYTDGSTSPGRRFILSLYVMFLAGSGADPGEIRTAAREMAAAMIPAWPDDPGDPDVEHFIDDSIKKRQRFSNKKLCGLLGVTTEVARKLDLKTIRPAAMAMEDDLARPAQTDLVTERRDYARQYIETYGRVTVRRLENIYKARGFRGASRQTAAKDLRSILGDRRPGRRRALDNHPVIL
jgi:hypothetical protein